MLSNFQAGGYPLLQIFLLGQPEFRSLFADPRLEQLRQRVIAMHQLDPMGLEELAPYLHHRLSVVGSTGRPAFERGAIEAIHRWSGGIPRKVNQLAGRVMLFGAIEQLDSFDAEAVETVIADLDNDTVVAGRPLAAAANAATGSAAATVEAFPPVKAAAAQADAGASVDHAAIDALHVRLARLEARLEEQDAALRRVLTLMVDFIEGEEGPKGISAPRRETAAWQ
jgi:hypothetical protein